MFCSEGRRRECTLHHHVPQYGPIAKINIVGVGSDKDKIIGVFDFSENTGMLDFLTEQGVVKEVVGYEPSDFVNIPLVRIDEEKLLAL